MFLIMQIYFKKIDEMRILKQVAGVCNVLEGFEMKNYSVKGDYVALSFRVVGIQNDEAPSSKAGRGAA